MGFEARTLLALERNTATIVSVMADDGNPQLTHQPTVIVGSHNCASDDFGMPIHAPKSPLKKQIDGKIERGIHENLERAQVTFHLKLRLSWFGREKAADLIIELASN
jgi:hypothetical protein